MMRECWFADDYGMIPSGTHHTYRRWTRALCHGFYPFTDGDDHYPVAVVERHDGTLEQVSIELVRMIDTDLLAEPRWVIQGPGVKPRDWRRLMTEVLEPPQCGTPWLQEVAEAKAAGKSCANCRSFAPRASMGMIAGVCLNDENDFDYTSKDSWCWCWEEDHLGGGWNG